jgi:hypothetical protein
VVSTGPGRALAFTYGLFALAAGARSAVQIATDFDRAPLAYSLSAVAALVYLVLAATIASPNPRAQRVALVACVAELTGVLCVGAASVAFGDSFDDQTVWSQFGAGYGWLPVVLPLLGLTWLGWLRSRGAWRR